MNRPLSCAGSSQRRSPLAHQSEASGSAGRPASMARFDGPRQAPFQRDAVQRKNSVVTSGVGECKGSTRMHRQRVDMPKPTAGLGCGRVRPSGAWRVASVLLHTLAISVTSVAFGASRERPPLSGQWAASPLVESWSFPAWSTACGPKPVAQNSAGGSSLVTEESGELAFAGPGRTYRTHQCWEQYPGLRRVAHSKGAHAWSSTCKSAADDPRQANIHTSVSLHGDSTIKFRETGSYEFYIQSSKCVAQVSRTRTFSRQLPEKVNEEGGAGAVSPSGSIPPAVAAPAPAAAASVPNSDGPMPVATSLATGGSPPGADGTDKVPTATSVQVRTSRHEVHHDCDQVGPAHEIRSPRPVHWLQPASSYRLAPVVVDAAGCVVSKGPFTYAMDPPAEAVTVGARTGVIQVGANAAEGTYSVVIRSGDLREVIEVPVVTREGLASFLQSSTPPPLASQTAAVVTTQEMLGTAPAAATDSATPRKWWFVALAGMVTLALGLLGLRLLRAGSRPTLPPAAPGTAIGKSSPSTLPSGPNSVPPTTRSEPPRSNPPAKPSSHAAPNVSGSAPPLEAWRMCPQCGELYQDGSVFCGADGARLVAATEIPLK